MLPKATLLFIFCSIFFFTTTAMSQTYHITIPNIKVASTQTQVIVPINVTENLTGQNITSYQGIINWNNSVIQYAQQDHNGTLTSSWGTSGWTQNVGTGSLNFGQFVAEPPLSGTGTIVKLIFNVVGNPGANSSITFSSFYLNTYQAITTNGSFKINTPPIAAGLGISPTNPKTTDNLTENYNYSDSDSDPQGSTEIRWYKNNVLQSTYNNTLTVPSSATKKGEQWYFTVKPHDGLEFGSMVSSPIVTIANTAPTATNLTITPTNPKTNDNLVGSYTFSDADGDPKGSEEIRWYKNTVLQSAYNNALTVPSSVTSRGEQWYFTVKPYDGTDYGTIVTSATIIIANTAPIASNLTIAPTSPLDNDNFVGSYSYNDVDNNPESGSEIRWYKNSAIQSSYNDLLTVPSSVTSAGDQWYFTIKPKDGTDFGILQTSPTASIGANISGKVNYGISGAPVKSTTITLSGGSQKVSITNTEGNFEFTGLAGGLNYTITPSKSNDYDIADINMYDASLTAQHAVQLITLTTNQKWAADVDKDGLILMYDASLIAMCAVGLTPPSGSQAGKWEFSPSNRSYNPLSSTQLNQNYNAVLFGDVDGNWQTSTFLVKEIKPSEEIVNPILNFETKPGDLITIPFIAHDGQEIYSADIVMSYDPAIVELKSIMKTDLSQEFHIVSNIKDNTLRLGLFGIKPLKGEGSYLAVQFEAIGKTGEASTINLDRFQINNGPAYKTTFSISITDDAAIAKSYSLKQNYPNPFNPETVIGYELKNEIPQMTIIRIYNIRGEFINTLVQREDLPGAYEVVWDGTDDSGIQVSSGVYLYKIASGSFTNIKKMIKMK